MRHFIAKPLIAATVLTVALPAAAGAAAPSCNAQHWIGAWAASPTDSGHGTAPLDAAIAGLIPSPDVNDSTVRSVLTPTYGGTRLRVRLSNRFGPDALTFKHVTIARRAVGAAIVPATLRQVTFHGRPGVKVPAGKDVISDPVRLSYRAFQTLAVSVYVPEDAGKGTRHGVARQTSYATATGAGDAASETGASMFTQKTTTRPFVTGIDVRAPRSAGAVVALGSSLTDGAQNQPNGIMESPEGVDQNVRYTDWLGRRLRAAGRPLSVLNAGISGNRILRDGSEGSAGITAFGPSTLKRLDADVIRQSGVTTVILWMGINDISQNPRAEPEAVIAGFKQLIARMHKAKVRVIQARLSPFKGYPVTAAQTRMTRRHAGPRSTTGSATTAPRTPLSTSTASSATPTSPTTSHLSTTTASTCTSTPRATRPSPPR